jgi:hypothetical protein
LSPQEDWQFIGPDCGKRTCPKGTSWSSIETSKMTVANRVFSPATTQSSDFLEVVAVNLDRDASLTRDLDFEINVISEGTNAYFSWKLRTDERWGPPFPVSDYDSLSKLLHLKADTTTPTGMYIYWNEAKSAGSTLAANLKQGDTYKFTASFNFGVEFNGGDANSAHQFKECSGIGSCEYSTGTCVCPPGYDGEACHRKTCPNSCSGHGVCQSLRRFIDDIGDNGLGYTDAWDADKEVLCLCDAGYRGPDCSLQECPSGVDPMNGFGASGVNPDGGVGPARDCSGRGVCDYSTGSCKCSKGYTGEACHIQTNFV